MVTENPIYELFSCKALGWPKMPSPFFPCYLRLKHSRTCVKSCWIWNSWRTGFLFFSLWAGLRVAAAVGIYSFCGFLINLRRFSRVKIPVGSLKAFDILWNVVINLSTAWDSTQGRTSKGLGFWNLQRISFFRQICLQDSPRCGNLSEAPECFV